MKRILALVLLMALVCSLCVFAPTAAALSEEEADALYEKYASIIDALEAGDYDAALDEVRGMKPPVEYEAVELTPENFYDYFEIGPGETNIERKSSGKIKSITPAGLRVTLKEEFWDRLDWDNSTLHLRVKASKNFARAKIDWETGEVSVSSKNDSDVKKALKKTGWVETKLDNTIDSVFSWWSAGWDLFYFKDSQYKYWTNGAAEPGKDVKYYQAVYSNIEVSEVSGTLYLAPEA